MLRSSEPDHEALSKHFYIWSDFGEWRTFQHSPLCVCVLTLILLGNQSAFSCTLIGRYIGKYIINEMHDGEQKAIGELAFWQTTLQ